MAAWGALGVLIAVELGAIALGLALRRRDERRRWAGRGVEDSGAWPMHVPQPSSGGRHRRAA